MLLMFLTSYINSNSFANDYEFYSRVAKLLKIITKKYS